MLRITYCSWPQTFNLHTVGDPTLRKARAAGRLAVRQFGAALEALGDVEPEDVDAPDDCSSPCWRNGGDHPCTCGGDEDDEGTTTGGW